MIRVLIVEDSQVVRDFLTFILSSDPNIQIIGTASNGEEAVKTVEDKRPDVVTMDINMPKMDGHEATKIIMETTPTPIVVVSASWDPKEVKKTFRAIDAGAVAVVRKPVGFTHPDYENQAKELVQAVKLMSEVKVVRRRHRKAFEGDIPVVPPVVGAAHRIDTVVMGASTGGPLVVETILSGLPKDFRVPILIVQHIAQGFVQGFADWLANSCRFPVKIAEQGELPLPAHAYVAPDNVHMGIGMGGRIFLSKHEPENGLCPSVSYLFRSVADVLGRNVAGVLLTGMGKDGAYELKMMKDKGAITIVQDKESCAVYGMPREAVAIDAATHILSPEGISLFLRSLAGGR